MGANRAEEARSACEDHLLSLPTDARITGYLGLIHIRSDDVARAESYLRRALVLDPHFWEAGLYLARCLQRQHRIDEAYDLCVEILHDKPGQRDVELLRDTLAPMYKGRVQGWEATSRLAERPQSMR